MDATQVKLLNRAIDEAEELQQRLNSLAPGSKAPFVGDRFPALQTLVGDVRAWELRNAGFITTIEVELPRPPSDLDLEALSQSDVVETLEQVLAVRADLQRLFDGGRM